MVPSQFAYAKTVSYNLQGTVFSVNPIPPRPTTS